jgi:SH3-like domain-containing protein
MKKFLFILFFSLCSLPLTSHAATNTSGLPLPRFVALKSAETNVRSGPGTRYPISWVYRRASMTVEIIEEYDLWRKIRDVEGTTGWVHKSMLDGKRTVMIKGKDPQVVRREPKDKSQPLLKSEPMVIAKLMECEKDWCRIQISGRKGWIEKTHLWGVYPDEVFD